MTSQRLESEGSNPSVPIADNGGTTARLPEQAKVVQEPARADLASFNTFYLKIPCRFCEVFFNLNCGLYRTFVL